MTTIHVTQELIDAHVEDVSSASRCPIAYAIREAGIPLECLFGYSSLMLGNGDKMIPLPPEAVAWQRDIVRDAERNHAIVGVDQIDPARLSRRPQPIEFEVEYP